NLGVVSIGHIGGPDHQSFVVADIPGLIEGAHQGAGLGTQFLRHIQRTRLLAHLVDVSDGSGRPDPVQDFEVITRELSSFHTDGEDEPEPLSDKPVLVVATKLDIANPEKLTALKKHARKLKLPFFAISAVTG